MKHTRAGRLQAQSPPAGSQRQFNRNIFAKPTDQHCYQEWIAILIYFCRAQRKRGVGFQRTAWNQVKYRVSPGKLFGSGCHEDANISQGTVEAAA
jgi:hypothetical protein